MNSYVKGYLLFLAFTVVTAVVVRPIAKNMNIPLLNNI